MAGKDRRTVRAPVDPSGWTVCSAETRKYTRIANSSCHTLNTSYPAVLRVSDAELRGGWDHAVREGGPGRPSSFTAPETSARPRCW